MNPLLGRMDKTMSALDEIFDIEPVEYHQDYSDNCYFCLAEYEFKQVKHKESCSWVLGKAELAALRARVEALEAHTSKLLELVLSFNEDDPWIFERNGGVEIVSNAQNFLKPEP